MVKFSEIIANRSENDIKEHFKEFPEDCCVDLSDPSILKFAKRCYMLGAGGALEELKEEI